GAREQCSRFIKWLDVPKGSDYKKLICQAVTGLPIYNGRTRLQDHDWALTLLNREGQLQAQLVGTACIQELWQFDSEHMVQGLATNLIGGRQVVLGPLSNTDDPRVIAIERVLSITRYLDPGGHQWSEAVKHIYEALAIADEVKNKVLTQMRNS